MRQQIRFDHLELIFTPVALSRAQGYMLGEVMDWVQEAAAAAAQKYGIRVLLIASFNRHEEMLLAEETARMAAERIDKGIVGLNLAGNEAGILCQSPLQVCLPRRARPGCTSPSMPESGQGLVTFVRRSKIWGRNG